MLISDTHRFVFVHLPKTGGHSVTAALQPWCLKDDRIDGMKHATVNQIYHEFFQGGLRSWELYTVFAVIRNPWAFVHSAWRYDQMMDAVLNGPTPPELQHLADRLTDEQRTKGHPGYARKAKLSLAESAAEVCAWLHHGAKVNWCHVWDEQGQERCAVPMLIKHEQIGLRWMELCATLKVGNIQPLSSNETLLPNGKPRGPYRDDYDPATKDLVAKHFAEDIAWGEYEF